MSIPSPSIPTPGSPGQQREHPSLFIIEEMEARGWSRDRLASEMAGNDAGQEYDICRLALDLYLDIGPSEQNLRLDPETLGRGFGVSAEFFRNLENAWLVGQGGEP